MFQLYRGERTLHQDVLVSPRALVVSLFFTCENNSLVLPCLTLYIIGFDLSSFSFYWQGKSLRFSGYQIAHSILGKNSITITSINISVLSLWVVIITNIAIIIIIIIVYFSVFQAFCVCLFLLWLPPSSLDGLALSRIILLSSKCWSGWKKLRLDFCKVQC